MTRRSVLGVFLAAGLVLPSCGKEEPPDNPPPIPPTTRGLLNGRVEGAAGEPVARARVAIGAKATTTNEQGYFTLDDLTPNQPLLLEVAAEAYARSSRNVIVPAGRTTFVRVPLLPFVASVSFDVSEGGTVEGAGAMVAFPPGAIEGAGLVTARLAVLDASDPEALRAFPGDFRTDQGALLESFGALAIEVSDEGGSLLNLRPGATAEIAIPVSGTGGADEVPLWSYDEAAGAWKREGTLTGCGDGVCDAVIPHLSWWNADQVLETTCVKVCVEDGGGHPSVGVSIEAQGLDYNGLSYGFTGADGCACLDVKRGGRVGLVGVSSNLITEPITVTAPDDAAQCGGPGCLDVATPLVVTTPKFQATLTWGEEPRDLDTHFTGPCDVEEEGCWDGRFHVYYSDLGSLSSAPWAALDTDDTTSYGPEVVTLGRCLAGRYRYSVHNYSGTPDLAVSGAKVNLLLPDGTMAQRTVPTQNPDAGMVWIVGDLTCTARCDCTWQAIDRFGPAEDASYHGP